MILFSHGSLLCGSGEALQAHAQRLKARGVAPIVEVGYLNYSEPPFDQAVETCLRQGATRLIITPYFLVPGKFVRVDLPEAVAKAQTAHPDITFVSAEAIGFDTLLAEALIESAQNALPPEYWREDLRRAPHYCRVNPDCPLYDSTECPVRVGLPFPSPRDARYPIPALRALSSRPALLVMVHGSPRPAANEDMFRVVNIIRAQDLFPIVEVGFMECNNPNIPEAIDACAAQGATEIRAVPYFLHTGTHVADDLPTLLEEGIARHPEISFAMGTFLGNSERLTDILEARIRTRIGAGED